MVHDNPYLKVWRSLPLDQTELSDLDWNKFGKMILTSHGFTPTYLKFELTFCGHWCQKGDVIHKDSVIGGAKKSNDIVRGSIKIWITQVEGASS
jgi:hypothetical protein